MRCPSTKSLLTFRNLDAKGANLIRRLAGAADDGDELETIIEKHCPETAKYVQQMHSSPYRSHMWRVTVALHAMDQILGTHGVEGLGPADAFSQGGAPPYEYLNAGDAYATTLVYTRKTDTLRVGCYGDVVERHGRNWE